MQCNQSFCGNGFPNGPMSCSNTPFQCSTNMYSDVVGEGEVTSLTLPDGTIQFFFMPTVKWWSPNTPQYYPNMAQSMYTNVCQPPWNYNAGTWFIRKICNPMPQTTCNPPYQRCDAPRNNNNSDCNMNCSNNGYQLKFHNDKWTSTTDMQYFYPCLRRDCVTKEPIKGTAAVQVNTSSENTACQYVVCTKPCKCHHDVRESNAVHTSMSIVSLKDPVKTCSDSSVDCFCGDDKTEKRKSTKSKKNKPQNVTCECNKTETDKILTANKTVTTYSDIGSGGCSSDGQQTQTCVVDNPQTSHRQRIPMILADKILQRCEVKKAETWHPVTPSSKKAVKRRCSEKTVENSDTDYNGECSSNCSCFSG